MKTIISAALLTLASSVAIAGTDFGTDQEARDITQQMVDIIKDQGLDAGIAAMHDASGPFLDTKMGVHIFQESIIVADNREPELIAASYAGVTDANGNDMWEMIQAAAAETTDFVTLWTHYDTNEPYEYHCFTQYAVEGQVTVMTCR